MRSLSRIGLVNIAQIGPSTSPLALIAFGIRRVRLTVSREGRRPQDRCRPGG